MNYLIILILALLSGMTTIIGVALAVFCRKNIKTIVAGIGFAAGIMILISFFELLPESISNLSLIKGLIIFALGALIFALLNFTIPHIHIFKEKSQFKNRLMRVAILITIGLILHDFPEGFAMANSFIVSPNLGILVAIAIALHNIPEEFAIAAPIVLLGNKKMLYKVAIISGLAEPAGAALGILGIIVLPQLVGYFLAFAAGAMVFISFHELIPLAVKYKEPIFLSLGLALSFITYLVLQYYLI